MKKVLMVMLSGMADDGRGVSTIRSAAGDEDHSEMTVIVVWKAAWAWI